MSFELTQDQELIRKSVAELAGKFDDHYWMEKDQAHEFPQEFYDAIAKGGWLGMTIPEEYGGHGLGITEATLLLEEVARSGAAMNGASAIHLSIFGMQPVVKHGSEELKKATLPRIVNGDLRAIITASTAARCGSPKLLSPRRSCCSPAPPPMTRSPRRPTA
jgi:acyl-CoA dehydrogenase